MAKLKAAATPNSRLALRRGDRLAMWVKSAVLTVGRPFPVFPVKQTFAVPAGMSQTCH